MLQITSSFPESIPVTPSHSSDSVLTAVDRSHTTYTLKDVSLDRVSPSVTSVPELELDSLTQPDLAQITSKLETLFRAAQTSRPLRIAGVIGSADRGCHAYARHIAKHCETLGVIFEKHELGVQSSQSASQAKAAVSKEVIELRKFEEAKSVIKALNGSDVDGMIVFTPIFGGELDESLRSCIAPRLDIEALSAVSVARYRSSAPIPFHQSLALQSSHRRPELRRLFPCTPVAVLQILQSAPELWNHSVSAERALKGKTIAIANRSAVFGHPLAVILAHCGADVYSIDTNDTLIYYRPIPYSFVTISTILNSQGSVRTEKASLPNHEIYSMADIIISAVPSSSFKVPELELKKGVGLINVSSEHNFTQKTIDNAGWYIPKVGAVTRWCLILNALLSRLSTEGTRDKGELGLKERIGYD